MKPTPGPWKYALAFQNNGPNYYVVTTGKWRAPAIAQVPREADAKLIAAAQDLFDGLKRVITLADEAIQQRMASEDPQDHETLDLLRADYEAARAALARARIQPSGG